MKPVKIYKVTFLSYTNFSKTAVSNQAEDCKNLKCIDVKSPFLIKEDDISYYQQFGGGFESIQFVGFLYVPEVDSSTCIAESDTNSSRVMYDPSFQYYATPCYLKMDQTTTTTDHAEEDK